MYLHLGQNTVVSEDSVIGIFDLDKTTSSKETRKFLSIAEKEHYLINIPDDIPKSFVLCNESKKNTVYLSQLNSQTLLKRTKGVTVNA